MTSRVSYLAEIPLFYGGVHNPIAWWVGCLGFEIGAVFLELETHIVVFSVLRSPQLKCFIFCVLVWFHLSSKINIDWIPDGNRFSLTMSFCSHSVALIRMIGRSLLVGQVCRTLSVS